MLFVIFFVNFRFSLSDAGVEIAKQLNAASDNESRLVDSLDTFEEDDKSPSSWSSGDKNKVLPTSVQEGYSFAPTATITAVKFPQNVSLRLFCFIIIIILKLFP